MACNRSRGLGPFMELRGRGAPSSYWRSAPPPCWDARGRTRKVAALAQSLVRPPPRPSIRARSPRTSPQPRARRGTPWPARASATTPPRSRRVLFDRIGMTNSTWILNTDTGKLGWILRSSARDMARFGLLALNRGRWNGVSVLADSAWFASSWRATPPDNAGYGLLWWLNGSSSYRTPGPYLLPSQAGPLIPSAPADLVVALGKGDKKIYVVPRLELVVVRHGEEADASGGNPLAASAFDEPWWRRLKTAFRY